MISHIYIGTSDFGNAFNFYSSVFDALGLKLKFKEENVPWAAWFSEGASRPLVIVGRPFDGKAASFGNGQMIAFLASNRETVRKVFDLALKFGGVSEGEPDLRPQYHEHYYGAYFRDLDGNKICVCCHDPE